MKSRETKESDVDDILNIYSTVERKAPASSLEGWTLSEVREQFLYWIRRDEFISILSESDEEILAFTFCRKASNKLATVEVLCKSDKYCTVCEENNVDDNISVDKFSNLIGNQPRQTNTSRNTAIPSENISISSSPGVYLMDELARILMEQGVTTVNCYINKEHADYRRFTKLLEYGGMKKVSEFAEYEIDLHED
jgi:hypothetical protein